MDRTISNVQKLKITKKYSTCDSPVTSSPPVSLIEMPFKTHQEDENQYFKFNDMKDNPDGKDETSSSTSLASSRNRLGFSKSQRNR